MLLSATIVLLLVCLGNQENPHELLLRLERQRHEAELAEAWDRPPAVGTEEPGRTRTGSRIIRGESWEGNEVHVHQWSGKKSHRPNRRDGTAIPLAEQQNRLKKRCSERNVCTKQNLTLCTLQYDLSLKNLLLPSVRFKTGIFLVSMKKNGRNLIRAETGESLRLDAKEPEAKALETYPRPEYDVLVGVERAFGLLYRDVPRLFYNRIPKTGSRSLLRMVKQISKMNGFQLVESKLYLNYSITPEQEVSQLRADAWNCWRNDTFAISETYETENERKFRFTMHRNLFGSASETVGAR